MTSAKPIQSASKTTLNLLGKDVDAFAAGANPGVNLTARDSLFQGLTSAGNHTELAHGKTLSAASVDFTKGQQ